MPNIDKRRIEENLRMQCVDRLRALSDLGQSINEEIIKSIIEEVILFTAEKITDFDVSDFTQDQIENLEFLLGSQFSMDLSSEMIILADPDIERGWLSSLADEDRTAFIRSKAYDKYLYRLGREDDVIKENNQIIDLILDLSGDPTTKGQWERRGLVMGNVQSGKTQNYIGLINKAADLGYQAIVILGGHMNELRNQTQFRVDEGFTGKNSFKVNTPKFGVGEFRNLTEYGTHVFTKGEKDFSRLIANTVGVDLNGLSFPAVFVIKKNTKLMENLYNWIHDTHDLNPEEGIQLDRPLLLIDDEADYASVSTLTPAQINEERKVTVTNRLIREILSLFKRNSYIGYTATPFANIFIDPDDSNEMLSHNLYPKDFMIKVPTPSSYSGQDFFFSDHLEESEHSPLRIIDVEDHEEKLLPISGQKKWMADDINELPEKLKEAIRAFLISTAVRFYRGDRHEHHSMIINVSHLAGVQNSLKIVVGEYIDELKEAIEATAGQDPQRALEQAQISEIHDTYKEIYSVIDEGWNDFFPELFIVSNKLQQYSINSMSDDNLDYETYKDQGLVAVIIGGIKLSRGMTLEGLSVSYFARSSKMYDTLMQMCRWFGYRNTGHGYQDLCRVYLTEDSIDWYTHISLAISELYEELAMMNRQNKTPSDFGLKVRDHPSSLLVTARVKMQSATSRMHSISLWGQRQRRFRWLQNDDGKNRRAMDVTDRFITKLSEDQAIVTSQVAESNPTAIFSNVSHQDVIEYIQDMQMLEDEVGDKGLINHIRTLESMLEEKKFKVAFRALENRTEPWYIKEMQNQNLDRVGEYEFAGKKIILPTRLVSLNKGIHKAPRTEMGEGTDESWFLDPEEIQRIKEEVKERSNNTKKAINDHFRRSPKRDFPALIIYPFSLISMIPYETRGSREDVDYNLQSIGDHPHVGYAISFPIDDPDLLNLDPNELRSRVRETRQIYRTGVVYEQLLMEFGDADYEEEDD